MKGNTPLFPPKDKDDNIVSHPRIPENNNDEIIDENWDKNDKKIDINNTKTLRQLINDSKFWKKNSVETIKNILLNSNEISLKGKYIIKYANNKKFIRIMATIHKFNKNQVGNGTTMSAIKSEHLTKKPTNNIWHLQKGIQLVKALSRLLKNPSLSKFERRYAKLTIKRLADSMKGKYNDK